MAKKKILVTSALPYVNNVPHLGNIIGSVLSADVFARFNRLIGNETLYICGTDEHGTATETKALEEGVTPKQICDKYYKIHKEIYDWFNISFDYFGRTSKKEHHEITQDIFKKLDKRGYIEEDEAFQLFCEKGKHFLADRYVEGACPFCKYEEARGDQCDNCGKLLTPKELKNAHCKIHKTKPASKKTKHLFLNLTKLQPKLETWAKKQSKDGFWSQNAWATTNAWFKEGLEKRAISRDLKWGIRVPKKGYENKVFYVWFDAPIGYISITAQFTDKWKDWWKKPKDVKLYQFMAKDNIPFHTIVFPASLIGADDNYTLLYHINSTEYLQYEDGKFSKSRHVGVFGDDAKNSKIPADAYRYYLLSNRPENADTIFCWEDFGKKHNNELVANLGNLVNRVLTFISKYQKGKITKTKLSSKELEFWDEMVVLQKAVTGELDKVLIKQALKTIFKISQSGNQYFQECEPWKTVKTSKDK
ncbi:methionine--tRNA ligase, partial [Candidatus Woesearchaeota archaeon]|nr:methionine--tRNA ligase [Candidatus Woesearchaeota archaeon]